MRAMICLVALLAVLPLSIATDQETQTYSWSEWRQQYNKEYANMYDEISHSVIWVDNVVGTDCYNEQTDSYRLEPKKFGDMSHCEYLCEIINYDPTFDDEYFEVARTMPIPEEFVTYVDWREFGIVTNVSDQGSYPNGWAFAATGAIESTWAIASDELSDLSEQEMIDCVNGSDNATDLIIDGYQFTIISHIDFEEGLCYEDEYPYLGPADECHDDACYETAYINGFTMLEPNEAAMLEAIQNQPLAVTLDASSYLFMHYADGIIDDSDCGTGSNHAGLVVGYNTTDNGTAYWIVRNSFGTDWGIDGYVYIAMGGNYCGIANHPSAPFF